MLACHRPPAALQTTLEVRHQFALKRGELELGGYMLAQLSSTQWQLQSLTPTGFALFTALSSPQGTQVTAPTPEMAAQLERIPFHRDLSLIYAWSCPQGRCQVSGGQVSEQRDADSLTRSWRGPGGPAQVRLEAGRAELTDPVRRYTLTLIGEQLSTGEI